MFLTYIASTLGCFTGYILGYLLITYLTKNAMKKQTDVFKDMIGGNFR